MPKNIVLCCDGTANEFAKDNTNVVKLYSTLVHDERAQSTYYHPGVGTMEPPGALTSTRRWFTRLLGQAIGAFLENDIRDAYTFVMRVYEPGDRLFMFGFSRGAYTVRAVASLLHMYGLLRQGNEALVPSAIRMMMAIQKARDRNSHEDAINDYFSLAREFKRTVSRECHPWFVGVWDTVSSVGWIENPLRLPFVADNPDIEIGRHAIAIDERRAFFRTNLWRPGNDSSRPHGPKDLVQVWFAGAHCDVGGGFSQAESGLSLLALQWMLDEASAVPVGLLFDRKQCHRVLGLENGLHSHPDPNDVLHESLTGAWKLAEFVPKRHFNWTTGHWERRMNLFRRRSIPDGSVIHWSVYERRDNYAARLPTGVTRLPKPPRLNQPLTAVTMADRTRPIRAEQYWNETGIHLTKGAQYRMTVVHGLGEQLHDASSVARSIEGEDWQSVPHKIANLMHGKRVDYAKWFALIGTVNREDPWVILDGGIVTAPADGPLICYFNDVKLELFYRNNAGWVVLNVEQIAAFPTSIES
jgi:hypothetical protein